MTGREDGPSADEADEADEGTILPQPRVMGWSLPGLAQVDWDTFPGMTLEQTLGRFSMLDMRTAPAAKTALHRVADNLEILWD